MSEQQQEKLENAMPEAVENICDDKENAPSEKTVSAKQSKNKKSKKRKKKRGVPVGIVAILLVLVIVAGVFFGIVLGYGLGRNSSSGRLQEANEQIDELTGLVEEAAGQEVDVFTDELTAENEAALGELSGEVTQEEDEGQASAMMSGEAFGGVDEIKQEDVIVAEFNGGKLTSIEVNEEYNRQMTSFIFAGFSEDEVAESLITDVMEYMVSDRVLQKQARSLGLLELSSADKDLIATEAQASYDEQVDFYRSHVRENGMSEEQVTEAAKAFLAEAEGVTYDSVYADLESGWWSQKLYDHVIRDVNVDSAAVLALYQERLAEQKANFTAYPDDYEYAQKNGETIVYNLPDYRAVKLLQLSFEDADAIETVFALEEELETLDAEKDLTRISEIQNQLNAIYATPEKQAQEVAAKLAEGADFDQLLNQYGTDEGMKDAKLRESGYYVSEFSPLWHQNVISAAMLLENPGDVSAPVRTGEGVCILSYVGPVAAGEVAMDKVVDELTEEALQNAQLLAYENQVAAWIEAADVKYYPERMQ